MQPSKSGPIWQSIAVDDRVKPKGRRKLGTVVAVIQPLGPNGISMHVAVRWDSSPKESQAWATDCLVVVERKS